MTAEQLKSLIAAGLPCEQLHLEGDGRHWFATIVSPAFEGKRAIARHQLVYAALGDRMRAVNPAAQWRTVDNLPLFVVVVVGLPAGHDDLALRGDR